MLYRFEYRVLRALLGIPFHPRGPDLDRAIYDALLRHVRLATSVDRGVALAFDHYHSDAGAPVDAAQGPAGPHSDLYVSNTLVHHLCRSEPHHFLFGASIHPYRTHRGSTAVHMLDQVAAAGAVLVKWLPLVQNIRADDPRTVAFLRRAGEIQMPMLIHYGGERALTTNHPQQADPRPLFAVLRDLRQQALLPPVIIAHFATPSAWPTGPFNYFEHTAQTLLDEFADAPVYCDTSAMGLFTRARWLKRLLRRPDLHRKLVHGSDFPIPVNPLCFMRQLGPGAFRLCRTRSWIERDYRLKLALGLGQEIMTRGWDIIRAGLAHRIARGIISAKTNSNQPAGDRPQETP